MIFGYTSLFAALFLCFSLSAADQRRVSLGDDLPRPAQLNTQPVEGRARSASLTPPAPVDAPTREWMHDRLHPSSPVGRTYLNDKKNSNFGCEKRASDGYANVLAKKALLRRRASSNPELGRTVAAQLARATSDSRLRAPVRSRETTPVRDDEKDSIEKALARARSQAARASALASDGDDDGSGSSSYVSACDEFDPDDGI